MQYKLLVYVKMRKKIEGYENEYKKMRSFTILSYFKFPDKKVLLWRMGHKFLQKICTYEINYKIRRRHTLEKCNLPSHRAHFICFVEF